MHLKPLTDGAITGTGTVNLSANGMQKLGGVLISTDGVNAVTVTLRKNDGSGYQVFEVTTVNSLFAVGPIEAAAAVHYTISGTGGSAQFYEWINR